MRLKFGTLFPLSALLTTPYAFAECNTVMGGCTKKDVVNVSPHMRCNTTTKATNTKPVAPVANQNIKNDNASGAQKSKTASSEKV